MSSLRQEDLNCLSSRTLGGQLHGHDGQKHNGRWPGYKSQTGIRTGTTKLITSQQYLPPTTLLDLIPLTMDESSQVTGVATVLDVQWSSSPSLRMQTIPILQGDALPHDEVSDNTLFMVVSLDCDLIERFLQEDGGLTRLLMDITDVSLYRSDAKMVLVSFLDFALVALSDIWVFRLYTGS